METLEYRLKNLDFQKKTIAYARVVDFIRYVNLYAYGLILFGGLCVSDSKHPQSISGCVHLWTILCVLHAHLMILCYS